MGVETLSAESKGELKERLRGFHLNHPDAIIKSTTERRQYGKGEDRERVIRYDCAIFYE